MRDLPLQGSRGKQLTCLICQGKQVEPGSAALALALQSISRATRGVGIETGYVPAWVSRTASLSRANTGMNTDALEFWILS